MMESDERQTASNKTIQLQVANDNTSDTEEAFVEAQETDQAMIGDPAAAKGEAKSAISKEDSGKLDNEGSQIDDDASSAVLSASSSLQAQPSAGDGNDDAKRDDSTAETSSNSSSLPHFSIAKVQKFTSRMKSSALGAASRVRAAAAARRDEGKRAVARGFAAATTASAAWKEERSMSTSSDVSAATTIEEDNSAGEPHIEDAMLWRNKEVSNNLVREFESERKVQTDSAVEMHRELWLTLMRSMKTSNDSNQKLRKVVVGMIDSEKMRLTTLSNLPRLGANEEEQANGTKSSLQRSLVDVQEQIDNTVSLCSKKIETLESQVLKAVLDDMVSDFANVTDEMLTEGERQDKQLTHTLNRVLLNYSDYDTLFREMAAGRGIHAVRKDLWIAELKYTVSLLRLKEAHALFVQSLRKMVFKYKAIERHRIEAVKKAVDACLALEGKESKVVIGTAQDGAEDSAVEEELSVVLGKFPEETVANLSRDAEEYPVYSRLTPPLQSPLVVKWGMIKKQQAIAGIAKSWKDVLCVATQDRFMHVFEIDTATEDREKAFLAAVATLAVPAQTQQSLNLLSFDRRSPKDSSGSSSGGLKTSIYLPHTQVAFSSSGQNTFELDYVVKSGTMMRMLGRMDGHVKQVFQANEQAESMEWVVCLRQFMVQQQKAEQ